MGRLDVIPGIAEHDFCVCRINHQSNGKQQKAKKIPLYRKANWGSMKELMNLFYNSKRKTEQNDKYKYTLEYVQGMPRK